MTTSQLKYIRDQYLSGKPPKEIAKDIGVCQATIYRYLQKGDHKIRRLNKIKSIIADYYSNLSIDQVLEKYNIKYGTLLLYISEYKKEKMI